MGGGNAFISVRGRVLLNSEALNMTESVGNYVKHRRIPVMLRKGTEYVTLYVPAVSGEAVAHGYQELLAKEAASRGLKVCRLCSRGVFLKSTNDKVINYAFGGSINLKGLDEHGIEKEIIKGCVVEDVGGFLYAPRAGGKQVKRTSNFYVGYMIPVREALENAVVEPQLHTRYALGTPFVSREEGERERGQMIYYVEIASAAYTFSFDLDTTYIGRTTHSAEHAGEATVTGPERAARIEAALEALKKLILELGFGAKKTRYLPTIEWESLAIAVSDAVWTVPSPFSSSYLEAAKKKLEVVNENTKLYIYEAGGKEPLEKVIMEALNDVMARVGPKG